ncbi:MAG: efflux transporter outer membrane subunit [Planctomycetota bacterium]
MSHPRTFCVSKLGYGLTMILLVSCLTGCSSIKYWWNNNAKIGPNYTAPGSPMAAAYTDSRQDLIKVDSQLEARWWTVFNDPDLNLLVESVFAENLTLKSVAWRIAESRAQRNIAAANLFPQSQAATGSYVHNQSSTNADGFAPFIPITTDNWSVGFDAAWELDLWGRIRRSIDSADANYQANVADYDSILITLIGDITSLYVNVRSLDERLQLAKKNIESLRGSLDIAQQRFDAGRTSKLDVVQAESNLAATEALVPQLELAQRQSLNAMAVLLGVPPSEIGFLSDEGGILPEVPSSAIVGIPAELLTRRPDIRAAERRLASQFEQIGIAEAELYPTFTISGNLGFQAAKASDLIQSGSYNGNIAPGFRWNILNYGRLRNGVRVEQARVNQLCFDFQNQVLVAQQEVEDGIVEFIKNSERLVYDRKSERAIRESLDLSLAEYKEGKIDFGRVFVVQSNLVQAQDQVVVTRANIALGLIATYKALGGGWEIRCSENGGMEAVEESIVTMANPADLNLSSASNEASEVSSDMPREPINAGLIQE